MKALNKILMDKADDNSSASGYGSENSTSTTTTTDTQTQGSSTNDTSKDASSTSGAEDKTTASGDQSQQASDKDVTGYGSKSDDKGAAKDQAVKDDKPLELDSKGLDESIVKDVSDFAKANNLTKEQAQSLVDKAKLQADAKIAQQEEYKQKEAAIFAKWEEDLKADAEFGGQNFDQNVHNVNKLLREELTGLKNLLTTSGKRLPPIVMKDLGRIAQKLYGESELVQGDKNSNNSSWNPIDFYKQKQ